MSRGTGRLIKSLKKIADVQYKLFTARYGQQLSDVLELPIKLVLSPFTLAFDIVGSAPRGFGVPELISKLSYASVFAIATLGTYDIALELGKKVICQSGLQVQKLSNLQWVAGIALYYVQRIRKGALPSEELHFEKGVELALQSWISQKSSLMQLGEKATAECIADAITDNRAELVHLPSTMDLHTPLPSKDCATCDGTGVMSCPECKHKLQVRISADDHIVHSMKDPSIAAFWLITLPQIVGGFNYDDDVKQKIWWQYKESMQYDQLRDLVDNRKPGWEHLQEALISMDPVRARDDPVIVKNIPYYKAKKALEAEVMKLDPPPRPSNWGSNLMKCFGNRNLPNQRPYRWSKLLRTWQELDLPLNASSWSEQDLKDPEKLYEMTVLLNAQREIADKILDVTWETKWREEKLNEMLEEKVRPYIQKIDNSVLSKPIVLQSHTQEQKNCVIIRQRFHLTSKIGIGDGFAKDHALSAANIHVMCMIPPFQQCVPRFRSRLLVVFVAQT
ncbi:hypothetical protein CJ030_MR0G001712 [Morella rubra]|uniref:AtTam37 zinc finger domain-containing protein n=1 Tax=Morella rubra TaxID=262757 RepID=A0A6A1UN08_9ROSI|nr:hypothetical protein CJ030_MR0G001712 [Morella rubra]